MDSLGGLTLKRPVVLIGPIFTDQAESVSIVNSAFVDGLSDRVQFVPHSITRQFGMQRAEKLNALNLFYLQKQIWQWMYRILRYRPCLAQYAIGSNWNLEKGLFLLKVARLCGLRTIGHLHSGGFITFWKGLDPKRKRTALRELRKLNGFVVLSQAWKKVVVQEIGLQAERVFVVNNPIPVEFEEAALQMPIARSEPHILALGVMEKAKGVLDLLEACRIVADNMPVRMTLAGPEREPNIYTEINRRIAEWGLRDNVQVLGEVRGTYKMELFQKASVFALPSYVENFPLTLLEAAAAGLGIVATPVGATPEFFKHGQSALFVRPGDVAGLAAALQELLGNEIKRVELGHAAREMSCQRLNRKQVMDAMHQTYVSVLRGQSCP